MKSRNEVDISTAEWIQPETGKRRFELRAGGDSVESLAFRSNGGTLARVESAAGRWTFKRVGFFHPRVTVRAEGSGKDLAVYQPDVWGRGALVFPGGESYAWRSTSVWRTERVLTGASGRVVIRFRPGVADQRMRDRLLKTQATVEVEGEIPAERLLLLLGFGMYLLTLQEDEETMALGGIF